MVRVNDIAKLVDGTVFGDGDIMVEGISSYKTAGKGDIAFALDDVELEKAGKSGAACLLTTVVADKYPKTTLRVKDIKSAMTILYNAMLETRSFAQGSIHPSALIDGTAVLGKNVSIGPNVVLGKGVRVGDNTVVKANCVIDSNVRIGEKSCIYPNVTVYGNTVIGNRVMIHSGAVIGADGFGYIPKDGRTYKVPQLGNVVIEDDVEIGANTCVDRGTFDTTVIGRGTKIDNLIQIAHNVKLGKNVLIAAQTGIAGSTSIGDNVLMGGMVGIADHSKIGNNVKIGAKTGVTGSVPDNDVIFGYPHRSANDAKKLYGFLSLLLRNASKIKKLLRSLPD